MIYFIKDKRLSPSTAFRLILILTPVILALCVFMGPSGIGLPDLQSQREILILRITRVLTGFIIGGALSCSGVVFQAVLRNPLAEPYVLGVSSGAGLGAALAILTGLSAAGAFILPLSAFIMAILTLFIVHLLSNRGSGASLYGLILSGVIVSSICSSLLMFMISVASLEGMHSVLWWMLGDLEVTSYALLLISGVIVLAGTAGVWMMSRELNALTLGHTMAHHLGIRVKAALVAALLLATLVAATAVSVAGLIGFVGLIVPHIMRTLVGADHRRLIPAATVGGGAFLAICDALARTVMPVEIPVGVVTALVGGPFFLYLLKRRQTPGWIE
jgi:iron complex transport system permease protein